MGIMEKMRNSTSIILWILILSFGLLWVLADTQVFDAISAGPRQLGEVNGDPITFDAYNNRVSYYLDQHSRQYGSDITAEIRAIYEQQAWDDLVTANLIEQKINALGIVVTDQELVDMITGPNPDPFIRQQFQDDSGQIDRVALRAAIEAPENSEIWIVIEQQLRDKRRQEKLTNYIASTNRVSREEVLREYRRSNSFADISYVRLPYSAVPQELLSVEESEIQAYYNKNRQDFRQDETYDFRYVSFPVQPTVQDTQRTFDDVRNLADAFRRAENDSTFLANVQSRIPFSSAYVARADIREEYRVVTGLAVGQVSDVVTIDGDPYVFKKTGQRGGDIQFGVLTFNVVPDPLETVDRISEQAEDFRFYAESDGFQSEADRLGLQVQPGFATKGAQFIPGFGQSVQVSRLLESMKAGQISDVVELDGQFVVITLDAVTKEGPRPLDEVRAQIRSILEQEKRKTAASSALQEAIATLSAPGVGTGADWSTLDGVDGITTGTSQNIRFSGFTVPGIGRDAILVGAISALPEGGVSPVIEGESGAYAVRIESKVVPSDASLDDTQRQRLELQLQQQKSAIYSQVLIQQMRDEADIKDFRSLLLQ